MAATPVPDTIETVTIGLEPGRNKLVLSVDAELSSGRIATDNDMITVTVR